MKLVLKGTDNPPYESGQDFSVMISFDDDVTAKRADEILGMFEQNLRDEQGRLFHQWWNVDVLAFTSMGELAALEAAMADMIIIAIHDGQELPETVADWLKRFLERRKGRPGALVAILASDPQMPDLSQGVLAQLQQAAASGHMDFFATRVNADWDKAGKGEARRIEAGRDEGMTRVASEAAEQFVLACKSGAKHKSPPAGKAPAEMWGVWKP
jgi:hypothetical protein